VILCALYPNLKYGGKFLLLSYVASYNVTNGVGKDIEVQSY